MKRAAGGAVEAAADAEALARKEGAGEPDCEAEEEMAGVRVASPVALGAAVPVPSDAVHAAVPVGRTLPDKLAHPDAEPDPDAEPLPEALGEPAGDAGP